MPSTSDPGGALRAPCRAPASDLTPRSRDRDAATNCDVTVASAPNAASCDAARYGQSAD